MKQLLFLAVMLLAYQSQAQRRITLYGQTLDARDILGTNIDFGPAGATHRTVLITTPVVATELNQLLGTYYSVNNFADATDLLNILTGEREPILDSINFKFYRTYAFLNVLDRNPTLRTDPQYRLFKTSFLGARTDAARRAILFDDANTTYREALEQSRYTIYRSPIAITAFTQIATNFKLGLGADATASIKQIPGASFKAGLQAAISNAINSNVRMTGATYHEIKLQPAYVSTASPILRYCAANPNQITGDSQFSTNLKLFLGSPNYAITAGAAVIESTFTTSSIKDLKAAIGAAVKANLALPTTADATKIAAEAEAKFSRDSLKQLGVTTGQSFYNIRLVYSPLLEVGANSGG